MSQCKRVLDYLKTNEYLEPMTALNQLGVWRLASRINDLRNQGHKIVTEKRDVCNRFNEKCRVAFYRLEG